MRLARIAVVIAGSAIVWGRPAAAAPNRSPQESAIVACSEAILEASQALTAAVERHLGHCLTHGLDCLTSAKNAASCCARVAGRCGDDQEDIADAERDFEALVSRRSCTRVPFTRLLAADGLGFGTVTARCACATPPITVTSLDDLARCLRRLVEDDAVERVALVKAPRAAEALVCLGLEDEFPAALAERPAFCDTCPAATPSASPAATATPTSAAGTPTTAATPGGTATAAVTETAAATPAATATAFATSTAGATSGATVTAAATPSPSPAAATSTPAPSTTALVLPSGTPTASRTPTPIRTLTPTAVETSTPVPSLTPTPAPTAVAICGNGIVEGDEQCDGTAFDTSQCLEDFCTCDDFCDDAGGTLGCNPDCTIDFSGCTAGGCEF